jgi:hypothetical protein
MHYGRHASICTIDSRVNERKVVFLRQEMEDVVKKVHNAYSVFSEYLRLFSGSPDEPAENPSWDDALAAVALFAFAAVLVAL